METFITRVKCEKYISEETFLLKQFSEKWQKNKQHCGKFRKVIITHIHYIQYTHILKNLRIRDGLLLSE